MPKTSSQAAVEAIGNRYDLIVVASERIRELNGNHARRMQSPYQNPLTALLEIENGLVSKSEYFNKIRERYERSRRKVNKHFE
jgi:DNA-directed RNA polymerase omega subunit